MHDQQNRFAPTVSFETAASLPDLSNQIEFLKPKAMKAWMALSTGSASCGSPYIFLMPEEQGQTTSGASSVR
jgi:hypothetical protein